MNQTASPRGKGTPTFVTGSIIRHILVMAGTSAIGLMAIFVGELANIFFLGLVEDVETVAAVGYGSSILFLTTSAGIGIAISTTALVSPAVGAGDRERARRLAAHTGLVALGLSAIVVALVWLAAPKLLTLLGATGRTHDLAMRFLNIVVPSLPLLSVGMYASALLRSVGDATRAMHITLSSAIVNIALDAILVLWLRHGIEGAAIATVIARVVVLGVGLHGASRIHDLIGRPNVPHLLADTPRILAIAFPAILTNVATPAGNAYVTAAMSRFGDDAVAAWAIIGRVIPVAFGALFALTGAIGPIIGQNLGAGLFDRVRATYLGALQVAVLLTLAAWLVLAIGSNTLADAFHAQGSTRELIIYFCRWLSPLFASIGLLFVTNAVFNTLGKPHYSTAFNWARATLGTIPFVHAGAMLAGAHGVLMGNLIGAAAFSALASYVCWRLIEAIAAEGERRSIPPRT